MPETRKPATLFGAMSFKERAGDFDADTWVYWRAGRERSGRMEGRRKDEQIMWFFDPTARNEFIAVFGGTPVTLNRNRTPSERARETVLQSLRLTSQGAT